MRVIPVIDLMHGQVVRGVAGRRSEYRPIKSQIAADPQPTTVANALVEQFGFDSAYVADLDAIMHRRPDVGAWKQISAAGLKLWLDAGMSAKALAAVLHKHQQQVPNALTVILGLESLTDLSLLIDSLAFWGPERVIFSLDLQCGSPLTTLPSWRLTSAMEIARSVIAAGIRRLLVLDLADVGVSSGTRTLELCRQIRGEFSAIELITGGGVRSLDDLKTLQQAGCDAALVASALHDGRLTREHVREAESWRR